MRRDFGGRKAAAARKRQRGVAIAALAFIAQEPERLGRFLALSGLGPDFLRAAAGQPDFLAGVLDHVLGDETLLLAFAQHADINPEEVTRAHRAVTGRTMGARPAVTDVSVATVWPTRRGRGLALHRLPLAAAAPFIAARAAVDRPYRLRCVLRHRREAR